MRGRRLHNRHGDEMRGKIDTGSRNPRAGDAIAALDRYRDARRVEAGRTAELAGCTVYVALTFLGEKRQNDWMTGGQREHPAGLRAAARDFHHHSVEGRDVELVAAEPARLHDPVEACANQLVVDVFGERCRLSRIRLGAPARLGSFCWRARSCPRASDLARAARSRIFAWKPTSTPR